MSLFDVVVRHCEDKQLKFDRSEESSRVHLGFRARNGGFMCLIDALEERQTVMVHALMPFMAPEGRRAEVAELVCRINYGTMVGGFDFSVEDGMLCFRTSTCFRDQLATPEAIDPLIGFAVSTADQWLPAFMEVVEGRTAREAWQRQRDGLQGASSQLRHLLGRMMGQDGTDQQGGKAAA